ncbi:integral membrane [Fusarium sporotrichioides]|uniref:Integral membrane n=1 Tax=Fusarium sporotrichioides TaxID=5514 RepID=A0A395S8V2_FUSSP|nr:integral membrane [Fusarium sporotrichioides]
MSVLNSCSGILLLASCGLWWEANDHLESLNMVGKVKVVVVHLLVFAGTAMMVMDIRTLSGQMKTNVACGCWGIAWLAAFVQAIYSLKAQGFGFGEPAQKLLTAATFGAVCAGVRIIYTILARTRLVYGLHPRGGSFTMTLSCVLLPEALATLFFVVVGVMTRGIGG